MRGSRQQVHGRHRFVAIVLTIAAITAVLASTSSPAANTWTQLTVTLTPTTKQTYESTQVNFSGATKNTTISYDDMSLTTS